MTRIAPIVPAESDILCESCGYTLNGLPDDGRCPECGEPVEKSLHGGRTLPAWELPETRGLRSFLSTTSAIIFRTTAFYRTLATRRDVRRPLIFARIHWFIASALFATTGAIHLRTLGGFSFTTGWPYPLWLQALLTIGFTIVTYLALAGVTWLAAKLTNWEATYRGIRLPTPVVLRGMYYHAAHYLPVALFALATVATYYVLRTNRVFGYRSDMRYLYTIAGEVIVGAIYLFQTYWIGMRNMMYANR
jgi:hypothetical protein